MSGHNRKHWKVQLYSLVTNVFYVLDGCCCCNAEEFYVPTTNVELNRIFQIFVVVCFTSVLDKPPLAAGSLGCSGNV